MISAKTGLGLLLVAVVAVATADENKHSPKLPPIQSAASLRQWEKEREQLKEQWTTILGQFPTTKPPLKTRHLEFQHLDGYTCEHIEYQVENGQFTDGYLLTPDKAPGRLPGLVVFHGTSGYGARGAAGLEPKYPEERRQGVQFVRCGYIVWCPRNYINTPGADYAGNAEKMLQHHRGWTGMTRMAWDTIRAADFMMSLPNVDKKKIGCFGHSLGGKEVLYAMAFDDRYCAGVSSEGGVGISFSNWEAIWYLGPKVKAPNFDHDHHELLALAAPHPLLLIAGDFADDDRSKVYIDAARPVYALYGREQDLQFFNHHKGHPYGPHAEIVAEEFLSKHLKDNLKPSR